jgi:hypothetical protein
MLFLGLAGASWATFTPMETALLQRLIPVEICGQVFGAPAFAGGSGGTAQGGARRCAAAISLGAACILAGLGGLASLSLRQLQQRER